MSEISISLVNLHDNINHIVHTFLEDLGYPSLDLSAGYIWCSCVSLPCFFLRPYSLRAEILATYFNM